MYKMQKLNQMTFLPGSPKELTVRQFNIIRSPKQNGTARDDSKPYLADLGIEIMNNPQPIQFLKNSDERVHRWSPYVQGFSSEFGQRTIENYKSYYHSPIIFDPFAGSGTVLVQSKLNHNEVYGVELNPLLHFIARTKINTWQVNPDRLLNISANLPSNGEYKAPEFLKSEHKNSYDLVITSPPYMNGLDYVMNYKIEMGWLGFAENHKQLKKVKDDMVVCDNVSKGLLQNFHNENQRYTNDWLEEIKLNIKQNIEQRGSYRRPDMPDIVHKYFDDLYIIMNNVAAAINYGRRFILVVGDSLIADVYVPTDLLLARIGKKIGLSIEKIEKARNRRSGQIRSYKLRESIVTLKKE